MKYRIEPQWFIIPVLFGLLLGLIFQSVLIGSIVLVVLLLPRFFGLYFSYAKDNPKHYWFKRKLYGWGWTPVTWEGWFVTFLYLAIVIAFSLTIDENSPPNEIVFTVVLPIVFFTILLIRICYRKGEKPKWQWGRDKK